MSGASVQITQRDVQYARLLTLFAARAGRAGNRVATLSVCAVIKGNWLVMGAQRSVHSAVRARFDVGGERQEAGLPNERRKFRCMHTHNMHNMFRCMHML